MSWAAKRITKRVEDRAYSLMGLFDVNMPMIYGEREKAFIRLQQNIIQKYRDESIFAWAMEHYEGPALTYSGLYAPSPSVYADCHEIVSTPGSSGFSEVQGELCLSARVESRTPGTDCLILNCTKTAYDGSRVGIMVAEMSNNDGTVYCRVLRSKQPSQVLVPVSGTGPKDIRIPIEPIKPPVSVYHGFWLRTLEPPFYTETQVAVLSCCYTPAPSYICQDFQHRDLFTGVVRLKPNASCPSPTWSQINWIKLGFSADNQPTSTLAGQR